MPLSDYSTSVGGGLKLKGVKDGRVKKSKKKAPKPTTDNDEAQPTDEQQLAKRPITPEPNESAPKFAKTEAQIQFEERRRKKLDEQAQREGVKSHKEKVEELNKYLSKLSEHHDMPRIGPG